MTTTNNTCLATRLAEINSAARAWMAEDSNRFAGMLTEDLSHWEGYGIHTAQELDKYLLATEVYESTKSIYGYKPSWKGLMESSMDELQREIESLSQAAEMEARAEEERDAWFKAEDAYNAEVDAHERSINPDGELFWNNGFWQVPA
jgi:hypothetical protein